MLFREWRFPRLSRGNPEVMNNPVWEWLVRSELYPQAANDYFPDPDPGETRPRWSFGVRMGQTSTPLPDGRVIWIAGEYEDSYDPDFYIYNDVIVRHPDGRIDIYGYDRDAFPPTDFHTATLVGDRIVIIGSLGYPDDRRPGTTPVAVLDLATFAMTRIVTSGTPPGWLWGHDAELSVDGTSIVVRHGEIDRGGDDVAPVENIDDWRMTLADWRWERLTDRGWPRWLFSPAHGGRSRLWEIGSAASNRDRAARREAWVGRFQTSMEELTTLLGRRPDLDLYTQRYRPSLPHEQLPKDARDHRVHRITIDGVIVRYVEDELVTLTIEGELPQHVLNALIDDLRTKLSAIENTEYRVTRL